MVSYAYFEKDDVQAANMAFFSSFGIGIVTQEENRGGRGGSFGKNKTKNSRRRRRSPFLPSPPPATDFFVIVSGSLCTPCASFNSILSPDARAKLPWAPRGISGAWSGVVGWEGTAATASDEKGAEHAGGGELMTTVTLLYRVENEGMDFGAHNVTLEWLSFLERHERGRGTRGELASSKNDDASISHRHRRFIFLNSSARGPFLPKYLPKGWHWTDAFCRDLDEEDEGAESGETSENMKQILEKRKKTVALVGAALTCLPAVDAGGPGPRVESWAFALSRKGLHLANEASVFGSHGCKLCADGVVVAGELTKTDREITRQIEGKKEKKSTTKKT